MDDEEYYSPASRERPQPPFDDDRSQGNQYPAPTERAPSASFDPAAASILQKNPADDNTRGQAYVSALTTGPRHDYSLHHRQPPPQLPPAPTISKYTVRTAIAPLVYGDPVHDRHTEASYQSYKSSGKGFNWSEPHASSSRGSPRSSRSKTQPRSWGAGDEDREIGPRRCGDPHMTQQEYLDRMRLASGRRKDGPWICGNRDCRFDNRGSFTPVNCNNCGRQRDEDAIDLDE